MASPATAKCQPEELKEKRTQGTGAENPGEAELWRQRADSLNPIFEISGLIHTFSDPLYAKAATEAGSALPAEDAETAEEQIPDLEALSAIRDYSEHKSLLLPVEILSGKHPQRAALAKMETLARKGLIVRSINPFGGWLTEKGVALLKGAAARQDY
jgi:hypothetical protein